MLREQAMHNLKLLFHPTASPRTADEERARRDQVAGALSELFLARASSAPPPPATPDPDELREKRERLDARLDVANVPPKYRDADLRDLPAWLPRAYCAQARVLLQLLERPTLLALAGPTGRGKSALACGLVRAFWEADRKAYRRNATELLREIAEASSFDGRPEERKTGVRNRYAMADLLVIDEVEGRDLQRLGLEAEIYDMINTRYEHERATVIISNLKPDALEANLGERLYRRLCDCRHQGGGIYECVWEEIESLRPRGEG